jgi:hypothetical protein
MSTRSSLGSSHDGFHSQKKNAHTIITATGNRNTRTGRRVRSPSQNVTPESSTSIGTEKPIAGRR